MALRVESTPSEESADSEDFEKIKGVHVGCAHASKETSDFLG